MRHLLSLALVTVLAGCTATAPDAPSLLPRPIEARSSAEPVVVQAEVATDPALDREIRARSAAFDTAAAAFDAAAKRAETRARRANAPVGSDAWLDAQSAIGELDQALSASEAALASLEELAINRAGEGQPPYPALDTAIATAQTRSEAAGATAARLKSQTAD